MHDSCWFSANKVSSLSPQAKNLWDALDADCVLGGVTLAIGPVDCDDLPSRDRSDGELTLLAFGVVCVCDLVLCIGDAGGVAFALVDGRGRNSGELGEGGCFANAGDAAGVAQEDCAEEEDAAAHDTGTLLLAGFGSATGTLLLAGLGTGADSADVARDGRPGLCVELGRLATWGARVGRDL